VSGGTPDTSKHVIAVTHSGTSTTIYVEGAAVATGAQDVGNLTLDRVEIGANAGTVYANMRVTRAVFFGAALSPDEVTSASGALAARYL
jgi:hypothetical protein